MPQQRLGFIGGGRMAEALARALIKANFCTARSVTVGEIRSSRRRHLAGTAKVKTTADNTLVVERSDVIVLAVKPHVVGDVLDEVADSVEARHLIVSIAAGVPTRSIESHLGGRPRVVQISAQMASSVVAMC